MTTSAEPALETSDCRRRIEAGRRPRRVRDHGRPGEGDDVPLALPARAARAARLPDRRRRGRRLDGRPAEGARAPVDRGHRREARRGDVRALRGPALLRRGRLRRRRHVRACRRRDRRRAASRSSTSRSRRSSSAGWSRASRDAGLTKNARVVVEKPFGHDLASARALADELHQYIDESQLYRIDHYLGKMGLEEILYLRFANAMLEPIWSRNYLESRADHDGGGLRGRGPRPLLRPGRRAARRRRQPPHAGRRCGAMEAPARRGPETIKDAQVGALPGGRGRRPGPLCARPVRRLPRRSTASRPTRPPRPTPRCASRSRTGAGRACPSSSARASASRRPRPSSGSSSSIRRSSASQPSTRPTEPNQLVVKLDPSTGIRLELDAHRADEPAPEPISSTWSSRRRAAKGRRPTRCCCTPRWSATTVRFTRQDGVEEQWRIMQPLLDAPPPVHSYAPGSWGPEGGGRARSPATAAGTSPGSTEPR